MKNKCTRIFMGFAILIIITAISQPCFAESLTETEMAELAVPPSNLTEDYDVVIVADNSGSVWEQQAERDQALRGIVNRAIGSDMRIGGVYFGEKICKTLSLTPMADEDGYACVQEFFRMTEQDEENRGTNIGKALEEARHILENQGGGRQKVIILFSDGINENMGDDADFKADADRMTLEQAKILEENEIALYCVYLQKSRNDEEYLKQLVNYFNSENKYENDRFKKVDVGEIEELSEQFAGIFYFMQNDMKYKTLSIDSSGRSTFCIPELGVERIQLCLESEKNFAIVKFDLLEHVDDAENIQIYSEGNSMYLGVNGPESGDWNLYVSEDGSEMKGTLTCYAAIYAYAETEGSQDGDGNIYVNQPQKIKVHFYDKDRKQFQPDIASEVSGIINLETEDGGTVTEEVVFSAVDEGYESSEFCLSEYGNYNYSINIKYEDFIDLNYDFQGGTVQSQKLITQDQDDFYLCSRSDNGMVFSLKAEDLYTDPNGEEVNIDGFSQQNDDNPLLNVEDGSDFIKFTVQKMGPVKFGIRLVSESGQSETVLIKGFALSKEAGALIFLAACMTIVGLVYYMYKKFSKKYLLARKIKIEEHHIQKDNEKIETLIREYKDEIKTAETVKNFFESNKLKELCENLDQDQIEYFKLKQFLEPKYIEETIHEMNMHAASVQRVIEEINKIPELQSFEINLMPQADKYEKLKQHADMLDEEIKRLEQSIEGFRKSSGEMNEKKDALEDKYKLLLQLLNTPITCDILVCFNDVCGSKQCTVDYQYIKGFFRLDESSMVNGKTLGEMYGDDGTGLYVRGVDDRETKACLCFWSLRGFWIKNEDEDQEDYVYERMLEKGRQYIISPNKTNGNIILKIK